MRNIIKYNNSIATFEKEEYQFSNFTRNIYIPEKYLSDEYSDKIFVNDDLNFFLSSYGIYGTDEYAELLMLYNNTTDPFCLPKSSQLLSAIIDSKFEKYVNKFILKGRDVDTPDLKVIDNIWYKFVSDEETNKEANEEQLTKLQEYDKKIETCAKKLELLEAEYESIKDDSEKTSFYRKKIRQEIADQRDIIFKFQEMKLEIEMNGVDEKGSWEPIRIKDLEKLISKVENKKMTEIYKRITLLETEENERFRYIRYPKPIYVSRIMDFINEGF